MRWLPFLYGFNAGFQASLAVEYVKEDHSPWLIGASLLCAGLWIACEIQRQKTDIIAGK